jgi:hypothetical protein
MLTIDIQAFYFVDPEKLDFGSGRRPFEASVLNLGEKSEPEN